MSKKNNKADGKKVRRKKLGFGTPDGARVLRMGYRGVAVVLALGLVWALPPGAAGRISLAMLGAAVVAALFGSALPDAFERRTTFLARLCGRGGRSLSRLLCEVGYRNTKTHSLGAFLALLCVCAGLPYFFGGLFGGLLALSALAGYASHLVLDLLVLEDQEDDAAGEKLPLLWPFARSEGAGFRPGLLWRRAELLRGNSEAADGGAGGAGSARILGSPARLGALLAGLSALAGLGLLVAELSTLGAFVYPTGLIGFCRDSVLTGLGGAIGHFAREPVSLAGVFVYVVGFFAITSYGLPRVERRVALAARDDEERRYIGDLASYRIIPLKGAKIEPARFSDELMQLSFGRDGRLNLELSVGEKVEARVSGRGIGGCISVLKGAYEGLATVERVEDAAEAFFVAPEAASAPLVPVVRLYEVSGEHPELGTNCLSDFARGRDPLGPGLSTVRNALCFRDGEQAFIGTTLVRGDERATEALEGTLERYEPPSQAERAEDKGRGDREKEERKRAEKDRRRHYRRGGDQWREADDVLEGVVGGLFEGAKTLILLPLRARKLLSRRERSRFDGRPETVRPEAKEVRARLDTKTLLHPGFYAVAYVRDGEGFEERKGQIELAFDRFFGAYSRKKRAEITAKKRWGRGAAGTRVGEVELRLEPDPERVGRRNPLAAMTPEEVAALWHPLGVDVGVDGRSESALVVKAPSVSAPRSGIFCGLCNHPGYLEEGVFGEIPALSRHTVVRGTTGMGKTAFEALFATEILKARAELGGRPEPLGMLLIDPTRSLYDSVMAMMPADRVRHVISVDPCDTRFEPPAFNLLFPTKEVPPQDLTGLLKAILENRFPGSFGQRMRPVLQKALLALTAANLVLMENGGEPRYTIYDLLETRFLRPRRELGGGDYETPPVREEVLEILAGDARWEDLLIYWREKDASQSATVQNEHWQPIWSMIQHFDDKGLRKIFGKPGRDFDLLECMERGYVVVLNLDKGTLQEPAGPVIGTIFLNLALKSAAGRYSRAADLGQVHLLRPFVLFLDEAQDFECPEIDTILTQGRKWAIPLVAAHQYAEQFSSDRQQALANADARIFFRATDDDAKKVAGLLNDPDFTPARVGSYPRHNFVFKRGEEFGGIVTCRTVKLPEIDETLRERMDSIKRLASQRIRKNGASILSRTQSAARAARAREETDGQAYDGQAYSSGFGSEGHEEPDEETGTQTKAGEKHGGRQHEARRREDEGEGAKEKEVEDLEELWRSSPDEDPTAPRAEEEADSEKYAEVLEREDYGDEDDEMVGDALPPQFLGGSRKGSDQGMEKEAKRPSGQNDDDDDEDDEMFDGRAKGAPS